MLWEKNKTMEEKQKNDFEIQMGNSKLQFERKSIERILPPLDSTPVGVKMSDTKKPATESTEH